MPLGGLLTLGIVGAVGGIGSAVVGAGASTKAADAQADAALQAAQLQAKAQADALAFQKQVYDTGQTNEAPFLAAGQGAVTQLSSLIQPGGELARGWTGSFAPPTAEEAEATPGYQFQLAEGEKALQQSAAASGNLLTGGTLKALNNYAQGVASTNYQQVFNNKLTAYQQAYNQFVNNQTTRYNQLAGLAGTGQIAAGQLGSQGSSAAGTNASTLLGGAQAQGQYLTGAANATASGYVGAANAIGGGVNSLTGTTQLLSLLKAFSPGTFSTPYQNATSGASVELPQGDILSELG